MIKKLTILLASVLLAFNCLGVITNGPAIQFNQFTTNAPGPTTSLVVSNMTATGNAYVEGNFNADSLFSIDGLQKYLQYNTPDEPQGFVYLGDINGNWFQYYLSINTFPDAAGFIFSDSAGNIYNDGGGNMSIQGIYNGVGSGLTGINYNQLNGTVPIPALPEYGLVSDYVDVWQLNNYNNYFAIQFSGSPQFAQIWGFYTQPGGSVNALFMHYYTFRQAGLTNFTAYVGEFATNGTTALTNNFTIRVATNNIALGQWGTYLLTTNNAVFHITGPSNTCVLSWSFNLPYGIVTNMANFYFGVYNADGTGGLTPNTNHFIQFESLFNAHN